MASWQGGEVVGLEVLLLRGVLHVAPLLRVLLGVGVVLVNIGHRLLRELPDVLSNLLGNLRRCRTIAPRTQLVEQARKLDRKSTRLNSSH